MQRHDDPASTIRAYHEVTKHGFEAYAPGPGGLDWATQPDPFLRFAGAQTIPLPFPTEDGGPTFSSVWEGQMLPPRSLDLTSIGALLYDSLAISAWKQAGASRWALRVDPSSGNLHPTECYVLSERLPSAPGGPMVAHYAPKEHLLEVRMHLQPRTVSALLEGLPRPALLIGLSSIHWRESWKYGERALRYCNHDLGHAIGALALAAASQGWTARLCDALSTEEVDQLLGTGEERGVESEQGECLLALTPHARPAPIDWRPSPESVAEVGALEREGTPNALSPSHVPWPHLAGAARAIRKGPDSHLPSAGPSARLRASDATVARATPFRTAVRSRRSALDFDGVGTMGATDLFLMLTSLDPQHPAPLWEALRWSAMVQVVLYLHRVKGVEPGLYVLPRGTDAQEHLREAMDPAFAWARVEGAPEGLPLRLLRAGDARDAAMHGSCHQQIASDGCLAVSMLVPFEQTIERHGAWAYPRMFWECGLLGQALYLLAPAMGLRATGIGCFFDDPIHRLLGLHDRTYQCLYNFAIGHPVEDRRLTTLPAYAASLVGQRRSG